LPQLGSSEQDLIMCSIKTRDSATVVHSAQCTVRMRHQSTGMWVINLTAPVERAEAGDTVAMPSQAGPECAGMPTA
jgi:hypothetical protein